MARTVRNEEDVNRAAREGTLAGFTVYRISFQNEAGELDFREVRTSRFADAGPRLKEAALELLNSVPFLNPGDRLIITADI